MINSVPLQETFDTVAEHLLRQGRQAKQKSASSGMVYCRLRDSAGRKCAVGCLIPDDRYDPDMESNASLNDEASRGPVFDLVIVELGHDFGLLARLQRMHDGVEPDDWYDELCTIAEKFSLALMNLHRVYMEVA